MKLSDHVDYTLKRRIKRFINRSILVHLNYANIVPFKICFNGVSINYLLRLQFDIEFNRVQIFSHDSSAFVFSIHSLFDVLHSLDPERLLMAKWDLG